MDRPSIKTTFGETKIIIETSLYLESYSEIFLGLNDPFFIYHRVEMTYYYTV